MVESAQLQLALRHQGRGRSTQLRVDSASHASGCVSTAGEAPVPECKGSPSLHPTVGNSPTQGSLGVKVKSEVSIAVEPCPPEPAVISCSGP